MANLRIPIQEIKKIIDRYKGEITDTTSPARLLEYVRDSNIKNLNITLSTNDFVRLIDEYCYRVNGGRPDVAVPELFEWIETLTVEMLDNILHD